MVVVVVVVVGRGVRVMKAGQKVGLFKFFSGCPRSHL